MIEVDQRLKSQVYVVLARRNTTLKAWFVAEAEKLVAPGNQMTMFREEPLAPAQTDNASVTSDSMAER